MKGTEQTNEDILECKTRAVELTSSQNPPSNRNGRRKGYIEVMKELWDEKGYAHLELKSPNLRHQDTRLEKLQGCVMDDYGEDKRNGPTQGQRKTLTRVGFELTTFDIALMNLLQSLEPMVSS